MSRQQQKVPNVRDKIFARVLVETKGDRKKAVAAIEGNPKRAHQIAYTMLQKPTVQREVEALISEKYPRLRDDYMVMLQGLLTDPNLTAKERIETLKLVNGILGFEAPKQSQSLKATVKVKTPMGSLGGDE